MSESLDLARAAAALGKASSEMFANMLFMDAYCSADSVPARHDVCAVIDLLKPLSCRLELRMPRSLADAIVEVLGPDDPNADDTVLEMLNVLAGSFISEYFGAGAPIKLELPMFLYEPDERAGDDIVAIKGNAEGQPFAVIIRSVRYRY
jgi:hypothetical protein